MLPGKELKQAVILFYCIVTRCTIEFFGEVLALPADAV